MSSKKYSIYGGKNEIFYWKAVKDSSRIICTEKYAVVHIYLCMPAVYGYITYFKPFSLRKGPYFLSSPLM